MSSQPDLPRNAGPDVIRAHLNQLLARRSRLNTEIQAVEELLLQRAIEKRDGLWPPRRAAAS